MQTMVTIQLPAWIPIEPSLLCLRNHAGALFTHGSPPRRSFLRLCREFAAIQFAKNALAGSISRPKRVSKDLSETVRYLREKFLPE